MSRVLRQSGHAGGLLNDERLRETELGVLVTIRTYITAPPLPASALYRPTYLANWSVGYHRLTSGVWVQDYASFSVRGDGYDQVYISGTAARIINSSGGTVVPLTTGFHTICNLPSIYRPSVGRELAFHSADGRLHPVLYVQASGAVQVYCTVAGSDGYIVGGGRFSRS